VVASLRVVLVVAEAYLLVVAVVFLQVVMAAAAVSPLVVAVVFLQVVGTAVVSRSVTGAVVFPSAAGAEAFRLEVLSLRRNLSRPTSRSPHSLRIASLIA